MAAQSAVVEDNISQLYDDQFIETCAPWVIPYIADLIGYNSIYEIAAASSDSRAEVANTIGYRQRKGTLLALEQLTADISGRATLAVEEFRRLITTESMRHVDPGHDATVSMRHGRPLGLLGTAVRRDEPHHRRAPHRAAVRAAPPIPTPRRSTSRCTGRAGPTSRTSRSTCGGGRAGPSPTRPRPRSAAGGTGSARSATTCRSSPPRRRARPSAA